MKPVKRIVIASSFSVLLFLLFACNNQPRHSYKDVEFKELFEPLMLSPTSFDSSIRYEFPVAVDSVFSKDYYLSFESNTLTAIKPKTSAPYLSNITVYIKGVPFGLAAHYSGENSRFSKYNNILLRQIEDGHLKIKILESNHCLAYWNCIPLKISKEDSLLSIPIPPFAKYTDNSHITIFSIDETNALDLAVVPLRKGKFVDYTKMRREAVLQAKDIVYQQIRHSLAQEFITLFDEYIQSEVNNPTSVTSLYGIYNVAQSTDSLCVLSAKYFELEQEVYLNKSENAVIHKIGDSTILIPPKNHSIFIKGLSTN